jgi:hypothetical protein
MKTLCCNNHLHSSRKVDFFLVLLFGPHTWTDYNSQSCSKNSPKNKKIKIKNVSFALSYGLTPIKTTHTLNLI